MLLTNSQAKAIVESLAQFNNVGARLIGTVRLSQYCSFTAWSDGDFSVTDNLKGIEQYADMAQFCTAYGLN